MERLKQDRFEVDILPVEGSSEVVMKVTEQKGDLLISGESRFRSPFDLIKDVGSTRSLLDRAAHGRDLAIVAGTLLTAGGLTSIFSGENLLTTYFIDPLTISLGFGFLLRGIDQLHYFKGKDRFNAIENAVQTTYQNYPTL